MQEAAEGERNMGNIWRELVDQHVAWEVGAGEPGGPQARGAGGRAAVAVEAGAAGMGAVEAVEAVVETASQAE